MTESILQRYRGIVLFSTLMSLFYTRVTENEINIEDKRDE